MTTITITGDAKRKCWMATSDTPGLPKMLRTAPVFEPHYPKCTAMHAFEMVKQCNPGCRVVLGENSHAVL